MKTITIVAAFVCFVQIANAQRQTASLAEFGLKGPVKEIIEYEYRGDINEINIDTTQNSFKTIIKFDEKGNELEEIRLGGTLAGKFLFDYSEDKTIIESQFDGNNKLRDKYIYKYDDHGNKIGFDNYFGTDLKSLLRVVYTYDDNKIIEENQYNDAFKSHIKSIFLYNEKNQMIEEHTYWNDKTDTFAKTLCLYDEFGNKIKSESYSSSGELESEYSCEYSDKDRYGNWLHKVFETKGHSRMQGNYLFKHIDKRLITYY